MHMHKSKVGLRHQTLDWKPKCARMRKNKRAEGETCPNLHAMSTIQLSVGLEGEMVRVTPQTEKAKNDSPRKLSQGQFEEA